MPGRSGIDLIKLVRAERPKLRHVILMCSAVNEIDASGLESLEAINHRLADGGIGMHLSEQIRVLEWGHVSFLVLMILVAVAAIDWISGRLRFAIIGRSPVGI